MISNIYTKEKTLLPRVEQDPKAVTLEAPGKVSIDSFSPRDPGVGEVRIRLEGCGISASNLPVWQGRPWFQYPLPAGNPGHEGWGIVEAIGVEVKGFALRQRVTGLTYNAFATHDIALADNLVILPDFFDNKPFPGEPLGCAMNVFERSQVSAGQTVAVVGCGFLGLILVQLLKSAQCKVIAISQREYSLTRAKEFGADHTLFLEDHQSIIEQVKQLTHGNFCDRTIEFTGKEWSLNVSIEITGTKGKLVVAGFHQDVMRLVNRQLLNWRGIDMVNADERHARHYIIGIKKAIDAIQKGKMYPFDLFTHQYRLEDIAEGFDTMMQRPDGFIKALVINGDNQ